MTTVYVSGASGFIAQELVKQLIEQKYKVVGSVRSVEKGENLVKNLGSSFLYDVIPDMAVEGAFDEALEKHPEVTVFLHTASPFTVTPTDIENDLLIPAQKGTTNALDAIYKHAPQIKRVVITSLYVAVWDLTKEFSDHSNLLTEESWNPVTLEQAKSNGMMAYCASKTYAEQAAWKFVKEKNPNFVLSTVNPGYVFGPQAFDSEIKDTLNLSSELLAKFLKTKPTDDMPQLYGGFVDVRDVARAHLVAFEKEEAKNQRLVLISDRFNGQEIADVIHKNFPEQGKNVPVGTPGEKAPVETWTRIDFSKTEKILGFKYIGLEEMVVDSIRQVITNTPKK